MMTFSMRTHCLRPTESLTWDDVCELWDGGVYSAKEMEMIATQYFDGAELLAVLKVIEKVENDSHSMEAMKTDAVDRVQHPSGRRKKGRLANHAWITF